MTFADLALPRLRVDERLYNLFLIIVFSFLLAATAQVVVPLPFSPVPITGQTFGVLLTGLLLGSRRGSAAVAAYLLQGLAGLPVFAGGRAGLAVLLGPTGGYLVGFLAAAFVIGRLAEREWDRSIAGTLAAMAAGSAVIYLFGAGWLAVVLGGVGPALTAGVLPFLVGDALKAALAAALLPAGWRLVGRNA